MINLELNSKQQENYNNLKMMAEHMMRPYSRKYDTEEHTTPVEMEEVAKLLAQDRPVAAAKGGGSDTGIKNGGNMMAVTAYEAMCWGDVGLMLSMPGRGLGNAAISAVATPEQLEKFGGRFAAMAITEPGAGSDSANISTTAVLDGDEWVLNGEKIYVTDGGRCDVVVVWATLDKSMGKAAIKSFLVEKGTPGCEVTRLEHKMGIRASDTAAITFSDCRIPKSNILGNPEVAKNAEERKKAFGGVMQTFDNTRPPVAAMAIGVGRAALDLTRELLGKENIELRFDKMPINSTAIEAELYRMEAEWSAARLLVQRAAWMADNKQPNSKEASMCKAKAGRMGNAVTLKCVELCSSLGYSENELLEKFARDSKILDIFEGTQQIQQLIVARRVLGKSSSELK
ncbi:acyl-CoA dehydrogenase [Halieaceae bacterium IMCC14734]|uniref:Acyl-CoA dehydrogenase n=1 Tax=Candidatus Litorirhabdus singularis TaxID=2518993 RepID=A0ABT3TL26_9GAMM|nr:acyl-CoA dehydrogenase family protein [Candidatus Litorirhabdus singularis]MCX2983032.1 acyl-CoA dehydrogenase [Candidatus Litorirhabdus singularis]